MPEPLTDRYAQDKAIVMSIVKYVLITLILAAAGYVSLKLFWILTPFIIGFILAKTSSSLSQSILSFFHKTGRGRKLSDSAAAADAAAADTAAAGQSAVEANPSAADQTEPMLSFPETGGNQKNGLAKEKKNTGTVLSIVVFAFLLLLLVGLIVLIAFIGAVQIRNLIDTLPHFFSADSINGFLDTLRNLSAQLGGFLPPSAITAIEGEMYSLQQLILKQVPGIATSLLNFILGMMAGLPIFFFWVVVVIVSGYFFLSDKRSVRGFLRRNIPSESFVVNIVQLVNRLFTTLFRTIGGYMLLLIITFILSLITLLAIKMPYAVILALVAAILDFMPVLGLSATFIPVAIYLAFTGNLVGAVGAVIGLAAMTIIRRFIEPPIVGSALRMHPMATLFSMIVGFGLFGISGFLLGPMLMVITTETLTQFHFDRKLRTWFGRLLDKVSND